MRKSPVRYLLLLLLLLLIGGLSWFWRVEQLPFQRADPLAAVGRSQPLLIALPDALSEGTPYPWQGELQRRNQLLDSLRLDTTVQWKQWYLVPGRGEAGEAVYTFIGEAATGLPANWQPLRYGPTLPFGGGDIYTFAYGQAEARCFARYRNLLLIGRYPFQLEAALRRLETETDNWATVTALQRLAAWRAPQAAGEIWLYPPALTVDLPADWLAAETIREWQQLTAARLSFAAVRDSSVQLKWVVVPTKAAAEPTSLPWAWLPPDLVSAFPLPLSTDMEAAGLANAWALQLPLGPAQAQGSEPNLWLAQLQDSAQWHRQQEAAELIDYEDYQTYRLSRWRNFPLLEEWTARRGILQAWTMVVEDQLVVALQREALERWLDLHLLGASLALDPQLGQLVQSGEKALGFLSWSTGETAPPLLRLLFPEATWARRGIGVFEAAEKGESWSGSGQIAVDWRSRPELQLRWTAPLPAGLNAYVPIVSPGQPEAAGWILGQWGGTGQVFTPAGLAARWALPAAQSQGPALRLPGLDGRYLLTTEQGVFQLGEDTAPLALPGTIGVRTAAALQLQLRGTNWEWLLLAQDGRMQLARSDGQLLANWQLAGEIDSLGQAQLWWQRNARSEQIIVGAEGLSWQSYDKQGNLQWEAPYPETAIATRAGGLDNAADPRLYLPLVDGRVQVLNQQGQQFYLSAGRGPVDHALVGQWWGDSRSDIVLQRGKLVHLFAYVEKDFGERWQYRLPVVPDTLITAGELGVMAVHSPTQQLWLLDGEGQLRAGFPILGSRQALLVRDQDGGPVLLVVADDELYAYGLVK